MCTHHHPTRPHMNTFSCPESLKRYCPHSGTQTPALFSLCLSPCSFQAWLSPAEGISFSSKPHPVCPARAPAPDFLWSPACVWGERRKEKVLWPEPQSVATPFPAIFGPGHWKTLGPWTVGMEIRNLESKSPTQPSPQPARQNSTLLLRQYNPGGSERVQPLNLSPCPRPSVVQPLEPENCDTNIPPKNICVYMHIYKLTYIKYNIICYYMLNITWYIKLTCINKYIHVYIYIN